MKTKVSNEVIKYFKKSEILNWNAYYHPDIPTSSFKNRKPVDQNKVCPIWSHLPKDRFKCHRIGELDRNGEPEYNWNMGCFPHHTRDSTNDESYKNEFSPCGNDVMGYGHRYSDDYYNPIQIYYLEKIFELGYKNYLIEEYPHRCSDLDDLDVKNSCLKEECSYIELGEVDTSGEYYDDEGFEYKDYINYMFEKTGMEADTAREACCNQILDEDLKALCNSDEIASNAVVEQRNI
ncbi:hypothetical protein HN451_02270 [archaeon]|nr:hypothetical protein [archaeon]